MIPSVVLQFDLFGILSNTYAFMILFILIGAMAGAFSRKLSISAFGALLVYSHVVIETDIFIFDMILWLVLFAIALWASSYVAAGYFDSKMGET